MAEISWDYKRFFERTSGSGERTRIETAFSFLSGTIGVKYIRIRQGEEHLLKDVLETVARSIADYASVQGKQFPNCVLEYGNFEESIDAQGNKCHMWVEVIPITDDNGKESDDMEVCSYTPLFVRNKEAIISSGYNGDPNSPKDDRVPGYNFAFPLSHLVAYLRNIKYITLKKDFNFYVGENCPQSFRAMFTRPRGEYIPPTRWMVPDDDSSGPDVIPQPLESGGENVRESRVPPTLVRGQSGGGGDDAAASDGQN